MADVFYEINTYHVLLYGRSSQSGTGEKAQIMLMSEGRAAVAARLYFYGPEMLATKADGVYGSEVIMMNLAISELSVTIDLLRNEKPIYIACYDWAHHAFLTTSFEAIGEGEAGV